MNNIGPGWGGDVPSRFIPPKLVPLDMETSSATPPTLPDNKPLIKGDNDGDKFIKKTVTGNPVFDATWDSFAVKPELTAPAAKSDAFQPTEASPPERRAVAVAFTNFIPRAGRDDASIVSRIINGLA